MSIFLHLRVEVVRGRSLFGRLGMVVEIMTIAIVMGTLTVFGHFLLVVQQKMVLYLGIVKNVHQH